MRKPDTLAEAARMAASELNSQLTLILNQATESLDLLDAGHPARAGLRELEGAALRCAGISRELLVSTLRFQPFPIPSRYSEDRNADPGN